MIEEMDHRLMEWVGTVVEGTPVSLGAPRDSQEAGVGVYLMELMPTPPVRGDHPALQVALRYLVTTWDPKPEEAHRLLGRLVFAALENPDFEVDREPLAPSLWQALGVAARPAFVVRALLKHEKPEPVRPMVRKALVIQNAPLAGLHGVVVGPDNVSIADARVEIPALHLSTRSDARGRFHFGTLPTGLAPTLVCVRAKGREVSVDAAPAIGSGEPLIIRLFGSEI